jgi:DNA helicase TIP49 (TBP-interacting protein)
MKYLTEREIKKLPPKELKKYEVRLEVHARKTEAETKKSRSELKRITKKKAKEPRFILILDEPRKQYLEWFSKTRKLAKAKIIRGFIDEVMFTDREYQAYLKSLAK